MLKKLVSYFIAIGILACVLVLFLRFGDDRASEQSSLQSTNSQNAKSSSTTAALNTVGYLSQQNGPALGVTPLSRTLSPASSVVGLSFSDLGLTFEAPWGDVSDIKEVGNPVTAVLISFDGGNRIFLKRSSPITFANVTALSSTIVTGYDFENAVLSASPNQVDSSTPSDQAVLTAMLLTLKASIWTINGPIYRFQTKYVEGFQHGLAEEGKTTAIDLYTSNGTQYGLQVMGTQPEIDYILQSIQ